jgi:hypothetical protein
MFLIQLTEQEYRLREARNTGTHVLQSNGKYKWVQRSEEEAIAAVESLNRSFPPDLNRFYLVEPDLGWKQDYRYDAGSGEISLPYGSGDNWSEDRIKVSSLEDAHRKARQWVVDYFEQSLSQL